MSCKFHRRPTWSNLSLLFCLVATVLVSVPARADQHDQHDRQQREHGYRGHPQQGRRDYYNHYYYGDSRPGYAYVPAPDYYVAPIPPPVVDFTFPLIIRR
jgi:hypothetical protein